MALSTSNAIEVLLAHYHARLLANPSIVARLETLGLATETMVTTLHMGFVDRTALRTLAAPGAPHSLAIREEWCKAGFFSASGHEYLRGCVVVPIADTGRVVAFQLQPQATLRVTPHHAIHGCSVFSIDLRPSDSEIACASSPLDALSLARYGCGRVISLGSDSGLDEGALHEFQSAVRATAPLPLRVIAGETGRGRALIATVIALANEQGRRIRVTVLHAGCRVADLTRLVGDCGTRARLAGGVPSQVIDAPRASPATTSPRSTRDAARQPWHALGGTMAKALREYISYVASNGRRSDEVTRCIRALELFRQRFHEDGSIDTKAVTGTALAAFQRDLLEGSIVGRGPPSRNACVRVIATVHRFIEWALREQHLVRDPRHGVAAVRGTKTPPPPVLTEGEVDRVLRLTAGRTPAGVRDRAMLELFYSCGIRRVELVGLDVQDIDFARGVLCIRRGKGGSTRLVPVGRRAQSWLADYIDSVRVRHITGVDEPALFLTRRGHRITPKMVTGRMKTRLRAAGIAKGGSCHIFRHSVATQMHDRGADLRDLQALLGHASITSTQLYTRVSMQRLLLVHAQTHPGEQMRPAV